MIAKLAPVTGWLRWFRSKGEQHLREAAPYVDKAVIWGHEQHSRLSNQLPRVDDVEAWIRENAAHLGLLKRARSNSLEHLERTLIRTAAAIRQESERRTRLLLNAAIGKPAGVLATMGIGAFIASCGVASTGTPIATLSGAAATTATLYWLGSLIGLGVAAGSAILGGAFFIIAFLAGTRGRSWLIGKPRSDDSLQDHERAILLASRSLIAAVKARIASGEKPAPSDMRLFAEHGLIPLADQINQHWDDASLKENGKSECQPFTKTLAFLHRRRLNQCRTELGRIAIAAMVAGQKH